MSHSICSIFDAFDHIESTLPRTHRTQTAYAVSVSIPLAIEEQPTSFVSNTIFERMCKRVTSKNHYFKHMP